MGERRENEEPRWLGADRGSERGIHHHEKAPAFPRGRLSDVVVMVVEDH